MVDKKKTFLMAAIFFCCLFLDQYTKHQMKGLSEGPEAFPIKLSVSYNSGFFLGNLSTISPVIRIIAVTAVFSLLIFISFLFNVFLAVSRFFSFSLGNVVFLAGISGNLLDKLLYGQVIDFIRPPWNYSMAFNFADIFLFIGFLFLAYGLIAHAEEIWRPNSTRKRVLIDKKYQFDLAGKVTSMTFLCSSMLALMAYGVLVTLKSPPEEQELYLFSLVLFIYIFISNSMVFMAVIYLSHRSAGPIYGLKRYVNSLLSGEEIAEENFHLRSSDYHPELAEIALKVKERVKAPKIKGNGD